MPVRFPSRGPNFDRRLSCQGDADIPCQGDDGLSLIRALTPKDTMTRTPGAAKRRVRRVAQIAFRCGTRRFAPVPYTTAMRYALAAAFAVLSLPAVAAPSRSECRQGAEVVASYAAVIRRIADTVEQRNAGAVAADATGALKDAFYRFEESRRELLPALEGYAAASDRLAARMRECAQ